MRLIAIKLTTVLFLFALSFDVFSQQTVDWMKALENPTDPSNKLKPQNKVDKYLEYDFSILFIPRSPFLGYVGDSFQKLSIFYTSVAKSEKDARFYFLSGISLVDGKKRAFKGSIGIQQIREFENLHYGLDNVYRNSGIKAEGVLVGNYKFEENRKQPNSGIFAGVMALYWVVDQYGIMHSDHIRWYSDGYKNNQYVGTWIEYGEKEATIANWGECRIPFSSNLDIGAAEFGPNPKYLDRGWDQLSLP